jgi:hypothetical protein
MPAKNDHAISLPDETLAQALALAEQLGALLQPYATPLTPDERHDLAKMGDKTLAFVEKAHELVKSNPNLRPSFLDVDEFGIDFADTVRLTPLLIALRQLTDTLLDTQGDDTLIFEGVDYSQLWFAKSSNGRSLEISNFDTGDKVTVTDWFLGASRQTEHIQAGGHELEAAEVQGLVDALAGYVPQPIDSDIVVGSSLDDILAGYWDALA